MAKSVFCTVDSAGKANQIVDRLKAEGFNSENVSVLMSDEAGTKEFAIDNQTKTPEGTAAGGGIGAALGGGLGWLAGIGALAIPGVGPLVAAGPILAALSGAAVGGLTGGLVGALVGMGIPEYEAKNYEGKLNSGHALLAVHAKDSDEADRVKEIFKSSDAEDISTSSESSKSVMG